MHHNDIAYWRYLQSLKPGDPDLPSPRVCRLLRRLFQRWREKPRWLSDRQTGHLFRHLPKSEQRSFEEMPIPLRKAKAIRRMLEIVLDDKIADVAGSCEIDPDEVIVGTMPPFSVGQGKEFVRYLTEEEELEFSLDYLNEMSPMGHIVPDHSRVVNRGLRAIIADCAARRANTVDDSERVFYESVEESLQGIIDFAEAYACHVERALERLPKSDPRRETLRQVAKRLCRVPAGPAETFHDAVQAIHLTHCALHWTVEIVPLGRLDQILWPFLKRDLETGATDLAAAQEILDCFWIKLDEPAILNYRHAENRFTSSDGVLTGFWGASNYDQGALLNQWMQQITIGGVLPNNDETAADACNEVTRLCLESSRRLPLNSPTLDLRVHPGTADAILDLAARALLSGGAHPVILNDSSIIKALRENSGNIISLADARDYACDGCFETMVAGKSEFSFGFVFAPQLIERALNRGMEIGGAGPTNLRGIKGSWRSPELADINSWEVFWNILERHTVLACHRYLRSLLNLYGNKVDVCPSPLLSALIDGCIESGRDLVAGGASYHIFSPLLIGVSTAADSLYVIRELVFEQRAFTLTELVACLAANWDPQSLLVRDGVTAPAHGPAISPERISQIHKLCCEQPKFGFGNPEVDKLGWQLIDSFCDQVSAALHDRIHASRLKALREKWSRPEKPFELVLAPGVGTFEQYVFLGSLMGASADGRKAREPIASDLSPAPLHHDQDPIANPRIGTLSAAFTTYSAPCMDRLGDGGPADYNLREDFDARELSRMLRQFADGKGGSIATFTVANPETLQGAQQKPEEFNLVRVRMGGWSEFFVTLFPEHQGQHRRRPLYIK